MSTIQCSLTITQIDGVLHITAELPEEHKGTVPYELIRVAGRSVDEVMQHLKEENLAEPLLRH